MNQHPAASFGESLILAVTSWKLSAHGIDWAAWAAGLAAVGTFLHGANAVLGTVLGWAAARSKVKRENGELRAELERLRIERADG